MVGMIPAGLTDAVHVTMGPAGRDDCRRLTIKRACTDLEWPLDRRARRYAAMAFKDIEFSLDYPTKAQLNR
jgi:hypothetical protein